MSDNKLPQTLQPFFWDTNFDALDKNTDKLYIIARLLTKGDIAEHIWVDENYTEEDIIQTAKNRRNLNPIVANYLRKKYALRKEDMAYYKVPGNNFWR